MSVNRILEIRDLSIVYHTVNGMIRAVQDVSLEVYRGESLCIVGESGSGKSTLGLAISMSLPRNASIVGGEIIYNGVDLTKLKPRELSKYRGREISMIFQDPLSTFNPLFTIGEHFIDVLKHGLGMDSSKGIEVAKELLRRVGLPDQDRILKSYPHELSGGMLQRVAIAIALSLNPKVLVADEPTSNLDVTIQAQVLDLLKSIREEYGLTLIMITHNLGVANEICNRIAVMYAGRIVEEGPIKSVLLKPLHPYTLGLRQSVPTVLKRSRLSYIPGSPPDLRNILRGCPFAERCSFKKSECYTWNPKLIEIEPGRRVSCILYGGK